MAVLLPAAMSALAASAPKRLARVLQPTAAGIEEAGRVLASGGLCAFPTETVYGLGANALHEPGVRRIFEVKGRPLSDPLIVHVADPEDALALVDLGAARSAAHRVFVALSGAFWPGPLTIVCPARPHLPACLSAGTGTVGVRCPASVLARDLITAAGVPVAAPSANLFGHVSPTTAQHVLDDLGDKELCVLDGGGEGERAEACCSHGIESTVCGLKIDGDAVSLVVYRRGAVTRAQIDAVVADAALADALGGAEGGDRVAAADTYATAATAPSTSGAPGQLLTHYAPRLPAALVTLTEVAGTDDARADAHLADCVVVDYGARLLPLADVARAYRDLSPTGDAAEAAAGLFSALRWAENVEGAKNVFVADLSGERNAPGLVAGVADRLYRAASGNAIDIPRAPPGEAAPVE